MPNYLTKTEVDARFDETFYEGNENSVHCKKHKLYATPIEIKNFLHSISQERLLAMEEWAKGKKAEIFELKYEQYKTQEEYQIEYHEQTLRIGYNQALSDLLSYINTLKT